jgi:RNA polymerase sigma-70 factor (ECF subfamily)
MSAYDAHHHDLLAFARALVRDPETAEDVVADAFLRLIKEVRAGRSPAETRGWLYRVVANLVVSRGRRLQTAQRYLSRLVDRRVQESPESSLAGSEVRADLLEAVAALPTDGRIALVMASRGSSGQEIAAALGKSETATRTVLYRARIRLREQLSEGVER